MLKHWLGDYGKNSGFQHNLNLTQIHVPNIGLMQQAKYAHNQRSGRRRDALLGMLEAMFTFSLSESGRAVTDSPPKLQSILLSRAVHDVTVAEPFVRSTREYWRSKQSESRLKSRGGPRFGTFVGAGK